MGNLLEIFAMYQCTYCDYKSLRLWCINRHSLKKHQHFQAQVEDYSTMLPREGLESEKGIQVGLGVQNLISRKRSRPNDDDQSETTSSVDSMDIDDFFSKSDSEESDMDVGSEQRVLNIIFRVY